MIDQTTLFTYLAILLGFVFIPGPAVIMTLARAGSGGTRVGLATALGIALGDVLHTAMAVLGLSALILASAFLFSLVKYLGAAYLVYLGLRAILERPRAGGLPGVASIATPLAFRQAALAEVLNPKAAFFFLAFLPQFVVPANGSVALQLSILGLLFVLMGLFATVVVALFAGRLRSLIIGSVAVRRWQGRVVGTIYCGLGIRMALQEK